MKVFFYEYKEDEERVKFIYWIVDFDNVVVVDLLISGE